MVVIRTYRSLDLSRPHKYGKCVLQCCQVILLLWFTVTHTYTCTEQRNSLLLKLVGWFSPLFLLRYMVMQHFLI